VWGEERGCGGRREGVEGGERVWGEEGGCGGRREGVGGRREEEEGGCVGGEGKLVVVPEYITLKLELILFNFV